MVRKAIPETRFAFSCTGCGKETALEAIAPAEPAGWVRPKYSSEEPPDL
jgi:hypothetical protein